MKMCQPFSLQSTSCLANYYLLSAIASMLHNQSQPAHDIPLADIVDVMLAVKAQMYLFEAANARHEHVARLLLDLAGEQSTAVLLDDGLAYVREGDKIFAEAEAAVALCEELGLSSQYTMIIFNPDLYPVGGKTTDGNLFYLKMVTGNR